MLVGDAAKPDWTPKAKCNISDNIVFARLKESTRFVGEYLDTDFKFLFSDNYANILTTEVEPKLKCKGMSETDRCWCHALSPRLTAEPSVLAVPSDRYGEHNLAYQEYPPKTAILPHVPSRSVCPWDMKK